ncbi:MAG: hypothetical protein JWO30_4048 [Fibrobacteres bacterium]|nr:hypothetical protein [Fibrobacterota bacterium]
MGLKIIVFGATGLAGSEVIRQAILDQGIDEVTAVVRRPLPIQHSKVKFVLHENYRDYSGLAGIFAAHDACIWCLGISQTQVRQDEYIKITYDYVVTAAQAMLNANPAITFVFLSGMGADSQEKSRTLFARIKGKAENNLKRLPFKKLFIARPGGIIPVHKKENAAFFEKLIIPFYPIIRFFAPGAMISSVVLAKAMLRLARNGSDRMLLENKALKKLVAGPD